MCKPKKRIIASHIKIKTKMKVKNLLLAGLAVAAMTACSNDEIVDSSAIATGEDASIRISFLAPVSETRGVTDGGTNAGSMDESKITTATIVLDYNGTKRIVKENMTLSGSPDGNNVRIASTSPFVVSAGTATIYAFINPTETLNDALTAGTAYNSLVIGTQAWTNLDYLTTTVAAKDMFLMSGASDGTFYIEAGKADNEVEIKVNRVAAKLEELTDANKAFELEAPTVTSKDGKLVAVKITDHSYSNLTKNSYALPQANSWTGESTYFQPVANGEFSWITTSVTYCLENKVGTAYNTAKATATNVHYKGQVYFYEAGSENYAAAGTFFVKTFYDGATKRTIYTSWNQMRNDFGNLPETEPANEADLKNYEIEKYTNGVCYYDAPIQHVGKNCTIERNNWYKLTVTTIDDLGWPGELPPPPTAPTKLIVTAQIQPWTIHNNNIGL